MLGAIAGDNSGGTPGIQTGDEVELTFSESIAGSPQISADNIDIVDCGEFGDKLDKDQWWRCAVAGINPLQGRFPGMEQPACINSGSVGGVSREAASSQAIRCLAMTIRLKLITADQT